MHDDNKAVFAEYRNCNWSKNSIHADNGDGDILTQDEVRELVEYGRYRGLEVYPEVPTLSHTDYICMAYPEIAERDNDPYPDTYCPNHPDTYKIVFDIMEEIIDVFNPKVINIGHDELYTAAKCERCRDFYPYELYVKDITTIYEWLKARGIRTMMWAEKLLPVITEKGKEYGGTGGRHFRDGVEIEAHPELYHCQFHLPRDIIMLHWYYSFGIQYDYVFHTHGYNAVVYGNLAASYVEKWRERRELGIKGGACSNWGANDPISMQRNNQYFNLIYSAYTLWDKNYDNDMSKRLSKMTFDEAFHKRFGSLDSKPYIKVTHTADTVIPYKCIWCGIFYNEDEYRLGSYKLTYKDGTSVNFKVLYGEKISTSEHVYNFDSDTSIFNDVSLTESSYNEVCYGAIPEMIDGTAYYKTVFENPYPEKEIASFEYVPEKDVNIRIEKVEC
jgi:hexosaminidase